MRAGSLRRRGTKWQYRASYGTRPSGRRDERSEVFAAPDLKAAEKHARALRARWDAEQASLANYRGTVAELVDEYTATRDHSPTTAARAAAILARIRNDLGPIRLANLTARDIDRWYRELAKPTTRTYTAKGETRSRPVTLAPNTIRHYARVLHAVLQQGYKWDMIASNVADKASPPKATRTDQAAHMPTVAALAVMLANANETVRTAVLLSAATGARRGEILALRWSDLTGGQLVVSQSLYQVPGKPMGRKSTKTGIVKVIPLPADMLAHLERFHAWQAEQARGAGVELVADGPIIANLSADLTGAVPHRPSWYSQEWTRLCERAGVTFKLHGLRHLHGSLLTDAGVSLAVAAKRQGHGVQVMAERYLHSVDGADLAAADVIGAELSPLFAIAETST